MREILKTLSKSLAVEILLYLKNHGEARYSEIKTLGHYTTVSKRLKELEKLGIVKRRVVDEYPPRVNYSLTRRGLEVLRVLKDLKDIF